MKIATSKIVTENDQIFKENHNFWTFFSLTMPLIWNCWISEVSSNYQELCNPYKNQRNQIHNLRKNVTLELLF